MNKYQQYDSLWVSKNFREPELWCPCCGLYIHSLRLLHALEKLRRLCGNAPIHVNSGTRCEAHNKAVGGAMKSKHLLGEAADIVVRGLLPVEVEIFISEIAAFNHGGVGLYDTFLHVDVRKEGSARWHG